MFSQAWTVFRKELKCILRDKRTFIIGLIIPLMLVPSMLFIIDFSMKSAETKNVSNINIGISDKDNSFYTFCSVQDKLTILDVSDPQQALNSEMISAYITVDKDLDNKILNKQDFDINVQYNEASLNSLMSTPMLTKYTSIYKELMTSIKEKYEINDANTLNEFASYAVLQDDEDEPGIMDSIDTSARYFNMLVPMMLILYCCVGSSSTASDLSAGEKERGTLESLLSTGADRTALITGKLFATTFMGVISGLCTVLGLWGYLLISAKESAVVLSVFGMVTLLLLIVFTSMFFAAVNLAIGVYSRSYKEAQTYLVPVALICQIPTIATYMMSVSSINLVYLCVPVLNIVCVIKEIFSGAINPVHISIVLGWLIVYTLAAFSITSRLFKKESVVFRI